MTKTTKTVINTLVLLSLGGALMYYVISQQDTASIWEKIKDANIKWIVLSVICGILSHLARALRWNLLLEPLGYKATAAGSFHAVILGYLVNMGLPRVGEITRPAVLSKLENIPFNKLVGTVVVERVIDLLITLMIAVAIFFIQFDIIADFVSHLFVSVDGGTTILFLALGGLFLGGLFLAYKYRNWFYKLAIFGKFKSMIEGLLDGIKTIFNLKRNGLFIAYSLFIWVMYFCMPFFVLFALEGTAHLGVSAGLTVLLFGTAAMIVPIPGGIGTFELIVPAALALYGIDALTADSYTIITHALQFIVILGTGVFSIIYYLIKISKTKQK